MELDQMTVLVTGAASGIGNALSRGRSGTGDIALYMASEACYHTPLKPASPGRCGSGSRSRAAQPVIERGRRSLLPFTPVVHED